MTDQSTAGEPLTDFAATRTPPNRVTVTPRVLALAAALLLSVLTPLLATVDLTITGRPFLAVAFMIFVPGVPVALALRLRSAQATTALAVATSFSYHVLFGTFAIVAGFWHPVGSSWIATVLGLIFTVIALRQEQRLPDRAAVAWRERAAALVNDRTRLVSLGLLVAAMLFWLWETGTIRLDDAAAYGLFQVISWRYVIALILLAAVTVHGLLQSRRDHLVLTAAASLWALIGYTTVPIADGNGNVPTGWVHVAFIQYISSNGTVPASYDARFSWPGFFSAGAQLVSLGGTSDARSFLVLAPLVYFLVALPGLLLIAHTITRSWRLSWVAAFVFLATNWYQQDYFSPQATAFVIYVTVIGTLLWMTDAAVVPHLNGNVAARLVGALKQTPPLPERMTVGTARALGILLAVLCAGVVVDHQLTPFTLIFALIGFTVTGRIRYRLLWVTTTLVFVGYFSYGATDFWIGHLQGLLGDLGQVGNAIDSGVGGRIVGDETYQSNQYVRIAWSLMLLVGAGVGAWTLRRRPGTLLLAGLACAPFALLVVQSYGGEVVIRSFLYGSPFLAPLFAIALHRGFALLSDRLSWKAPAASMNLSRTTWVPMAVLLPVALIAGLVLTFTRGLNASFERTPPDQAAAAQMVQEVAAPGDQVALPLFAGLTPTPNILEIRPRYISADVCVVADLAGCLEDPLPRFVLISITQDRTGQLTSSRPEGWVWSMGQQLLDSGRYTRIYDGADAWLLESTSPGGS